MVGYRFLLLIIHSAVRIDWTLAALEGTPHAGGI